MDGFIVIDKPAGKTSHDVVNAVRRILGTKKIGHTGTLDPFATGVLPIAVGEATKAIQFLDETVKQYRAVMRLGRTTDTQDCTGRIVAEAGCAAITEKLLTEVFTRFTGVVSQVPPMFSAIKKDGRPLYELARRGIEIEREPRTVNIFSLKLEGFVSPDVTFTVSCSPGTYVRTLAHDIGVALESGAHLVSLQRLRSGFFPLDEAYSLDALSELQKAARSDDCIIPLLEALHHLPEVCLDESDAARVRNGMSPLCQEVIALALEGSTSPGRVKLSFQGKLLAVVAVGPAGTDNALKTLRLLRVFH